MSRRKLPWLILVAVLLVYSGGRLDGDGGSERGRTGESGPLAPGATLHGHVVKITDGDTVRVRLDDGGEERVRYIGIDTPETHRPDTPVQCFGPQASERNARLVSGRDVELRLDAEPRDRFDRLLAYVYRRPDGLFVNETLVRDGFARTLSIRPNVRFAGRFARLADQASGRGIGLWAAC